MFIYLAVECIPTEKGRIKRNEWLRIKRRTALNDSTLNQKKRKDQKET